jgi:hypothetical protein
MKVALVAFHMAAAPACCQSWERVSMMESGRRSCSICDAEAEEETSEEGEGGVRGRRERDLSDSDGGGGLVGVK